jgi:phosphoribosylformylglycinamidine synthase
MAEDCVKRGLVGFRYVNHDRTVASRYPFNPSGSPLGIATMSILDGRVTITMPHPERSFRYVQNSWHPRSVGECSGWMRLFRNAWRLVG